MKDGKLDDNACAYADFAFDLDNSPVQLDAAFDQEEAQAGAGASADVGAPMKGFKQMLLILRRDPDPVIAHHAHNVLRLAANGELYARPGLGIFYRVAQQVCKDVSEQSFIREGFSWNVIERQFDPAPGARRRKNLIDKLMAKEVQVKRGWLEIELARIEAAQDKNPLHHSRHAPGISGDGLELLIALVRLHFLLELPKKLGR